MNEKKDSNPKDALGIKKVPFHVIPSKPLLEVGLAMMEGGRKYGSHNYREIGVSMSTYYNAAMRHLVAWWEGEDIDPDSGVHHIVKAMASLFVVRDGMHMGNCIDDRPIRYPTGILMAEFNEAAAKLISTYPECVEPYTQVGATTGRITSDEYNAKEIDGPLKFEPGDIVSIEPYSGAGDLIRKLCQEAGYRGTYIKTDGNGHLVKIGRIDRWFFNDEVLTVEDN